MPGTQRVYGATGEPEPEERGPTPQRPFGTPHAYQPTVPASLIRTNVVVGPYSSRGTVVGVALYASVVACSVLTKAYHDTICC